MAKCPICEGHRWSPAVRDLMICQKCGVRRRQSIPTIAELKERTKNFQLTAAKKKSVRRERLANAEKQLELLALEPSGRIYDVGAAGGFFLKVARDHGWRPYGNEISMAAIEWAGKHYSLDLDYGVLEEVVAEIGWFEEAFGAVVMWNTLEHCIDPLTTLQAAFTMLKAGGVLLVSVPVKRPHELERTYAGAHLTEFTESSLRLCAERAGFQLDWLCTREARHCRQADMRCLR